MISGCMPKQLNLCVYSMVGFFNPDDVSRYFIYYILSPFRLVRSAVHDESRRLVVGVEQSIGNDDILPPGGSKDNDLGNIIRRKRVAASVDGIGLGLVAVKADDGKLRLDLAGVDFDDPDASGDELLSQALRKASDGGLGGAVD